MPIQKNITKYINLFSGGMIAFIVVMVPLGYFLISYQYLRGNLETEADREGAGKGSKFTFVIPV